MIEDILNKNSTELVSLFHRINKELTSHLLNGSSWDEQRNRISLLTEISKELSRRKIDSSVDYATGPKGVSK